MVLFLCPLCRCYEQEQDTALELAPALVELIRDSTPEVRRCAITATKAFAKAEPTLSAQLLAQVSVFVAAAFSAEPSRLCPSASVFTCCLMVAALQLVPPLLATVKDRDIAIKMASERALLHLLQINSDPAVLAVR